MLNLLPEHGKDATEPGIRASPPERRVRGRRGRDPLGNPPERRVRGRGRGRGRDPLGNPQERRVRGRGRDPHERKRASIYLGPRSTN